MRPGFLACAIAFWTLLVVSVPAFAQIPPPPPPNAQRKDDPNALKLKPGDLLYIDVAGAKDYSGEFTVLTDGSISGRFGRLTVSGKSVMQTENLLTSALRRYLVDPVISVTVKTMRKEFVFVAGAKQPESGIFDYSPDLDLRQLVAQVQLADDPDLFDATLFRASSAPAQIDLSALLRGDAQQNRKLQPGDLLSITPKTYVRVWVTGLVTKPGQIRVPVGSNVSKAVAIAGGLQTTSIGGGPVKLSDADFVVTLRRGPDSKAVHLDDSSVLESGDTVNVQMPVMNRVTVAGEVNSPGEYFLRQGESISSAIARAGEAKISATLLDVMVLRRDGVFRYDATALQRGEAPESVRPQDGDLIFVRKNQRDFLVLGEVDKPGRYVISDMKPIHATDALALAGGLQDRGTFRRVYLARPGKDGKVTITKFNLDEYIKSGKKESNPIIEAGDVLLFSEIDNLNFNGMSQILSSALLIDSLTRRR